LERAKDLGATVTIDVERRTLRDEVLEATGGDGCEIVFVTPGSRAALQAAATCVAPGGTLVIFTPLAPHELWPIDVHDLFFKDVSIVTSYSSGPDDTREALKLLTSGLAVEPLFTHRFRLDEAANAYAAMKNAEASLKVIVYP
jgi:L-iditol 2-dehydrogenase